MLRGFAGVYLANRLNFSFGARLFFHLIRLPLDYFQRRHVGDVISRFRSLKPVQEFITGGVVAAGIDGAMALTTLIVIFVYSPLLAGIALGAFVFYAALRIALLRPLRARNHESIAADAWLDSHFLETIRALQGVKLFGKEAERERAWQDLFVDSINAGVRVTRLNLGYDALNGLLLGLRACSSCSSARTSAIGRADDRHALRVHRVSDTLFERDEFADHADRAGADAGAAPRTDIGHRVRGTGARPPRAFVVHRAGARRVARGTPGFHLSRRWPPLLHDLDLNVDAGERLAVIGPSGVGKSTLLRLLVGLIRPTGGRIDVDGIPLDRLGIRSYRAGIAALMQDDVLLSGSIHDNIAFFDLAVDPAKLERATRIAHIYDDIVQLPMGFDTRIGDMGSALSIGQQQRLLLARALYREPSILFLDEGTSHLDLPTELAIMQSIADLGITCIYTTHRDARRDSPTRCCR